MLLRKFFMPTQIFMGNACIRELPKCFAEHGVKKVLLVTDAGIVKAGVVAKITQLLDEAGIEYAIFDKVLPDPHVEVLEQGLAFARDTRINGVVGIGGGSPIDMGKLINCMLNNPGGISDYYGAGKVQRKGFPFFAIPTTCGTGTEATPIGIIINPQTQIKHFVNSKHLFPDVAFVDPDLIEQLPPKLIATTGMDALTHAIETYTASTSSPISDALAIYAIQLIAENLQQAVLSLQYKDALGNILLGSTLAGMAFPNGGLGLVHSLGHPLGGVFGIPHGLAMAVLLPYVMKYNMHANLEKFARIALAMGEDIDAMRMADAAARSLDAVLRLSDAIGIPKNLKDLGVESDKFDKMVEDANISAGIYQNTRRNTPEDLKQIYWNAYNGTL